MKSVRSYTGKRERSAGPGIKNWSAGIRFGFFGRNVRLQPCALTSRHIAMKTGSLLSPERAEQSNQCGRRGGEPRVGYLRKRGGTPSVIARIKRDRDKRPLSAAGYLFMPGAP